MNAASGLLLVTVATFLLSMKGIFAKLGFAAGASIDATLLLRFSLCVPLVWLFVKLRGRWRLFGSLRWQDFLFFAPLAFFGYYLGSKFDYQAINIAGASISRLLLLTYPIFVVAINVAVTRKLPSLTQFVSVMACQFGIALTIGASGDELLNTNLYGGLFSMASAFSYAIYIVMIDRRGGGYDSQFMVAWVVTIAALYLFIDFATTNSVQELVLSPEAWFWIAMTAVFSTALPLTLYAEAIKRVGGVNSSIMSALGPVFTIGVAYLVFAETLTTFQVLGAAIIVASVYFLSRTAKE